MRCALVFLLVATIFVIVYSAPELCVFRVQGAICGRDRVGYTIEFIPPISQNITYINLHGQPLKQLPDNAFRNLSSQSGVFEIYLKYCQISHVDPGALLNLHKLTIIDLSHNDITQMNSKLFSDTKQIKYIYLEYNKIEVLPSGLFQNLTQLKAVYVEHNRIRQVEWFSFQNTPSLRLIGLQHNQIEFINMLFKDRFENLTYLWLHSNPWKCDCALGALYEFLIRIDQLNQHRLECDKPPTLQGRKWKDISRDTFVCPLENATTTRDSVMSGTEPVATTEADDNVPVTAYNGTRYQPVDTDVLQPNSNQNWILYTILCLCVAAVIIGVVLFKQRSARRTNAHNIDSDLLMPAVQSSTVSERDNSVLNMADVDEEQTL